MYLVLKLPEVQGNYAYKVKYNNFIFFPSLQAFTAGTEYGVVWLAEKEGFRAPAMFYNPVTPWLR